MVLRIHPARLAATAVTALLPIAIATASAETGKTTTLQDRMQDANERILSKHGVDIAGKISSEYFHSGVTGTAVTDTNYAFETTQYTSFDLDMQYRAFDFVSARADLRFYQDWQTFFATRSRILAARWLSVDGNYANTLGFNVGDFRQKYSQLTLWSPELDLVYEPLIFSRARQDLMDEQYIGDNDRLLQGANLNFARRFESPLNEFRLDAIASRVRRGEFLDSGGYQGFHFAKSDMDRFLLAGNTEAFVLNNLFVGGTYLTLMDDRESFQHTAHSAAYLQALNDVGQPADPDWSLNDKDSVIARNINVVSGRAGADIAGFLRNPNVTLEFLGEVAQSQESNRYAWHFKTDTTGGAHLVDYGATAPGKDGKALLMEMTAGYHKQDSAYGMELTADYINNEAAYLNPLAQSPTFVGTRIMNTENDFGGRKLYSTFDALNNGVYKFSPSSQQIKPGVNGYQQAPYSKTSYNNGVFSPEDLTGFAGDPVLQLVLPFGNATPNRSGVKGRLTGQWANTYHLTVDAAFVNELEGAIVDSLTAPLASFTQMGGGLMIEAGKLMHMERPLEISGSFVRSGAKRDKTAKDLLDPAITADLMMAGLHWQFLSKFGLLLGYQQSVVTSPFRQLEKGDAPDTKFHVYQYSLDETQRHFRAGIEYTVARDACLMLSGGFLNVDRSYVNKGTPDNTAGAVPARDLHLDFTDALTQALIRVKF